MHWLAATLPTLTIDKWARPGEVKPVRPPAKSISELVAFTKRPFWNEALSARSLKASLYWMTLRGDVTLVTGWVVVVISSAALKAGQPLPAGASALNFICAVLVLSKPVSDGNTKVKTAKR